MSEPTEREPLTDDEIEFVERMRKNLEIMGGRSGLVGGHASWLRVVDKLRTALRAAEERAEIAERFNREWPHNSYKTALERLQAEARWVVDIAEADYGMVCTELHAAINLAVAALEESPDAKEPQA